MAADKFFPSTQASMNVLGRERGWGFYDRARFDAARSFEGVLYVGDPETVAQKSFICASMWALPASCFTCPWERCLTTKS